MSVPPPLNRPQSLRLLIDPSSNFRTISPITPSPFSPPRREPWGYESPSGEYYERICSVIGLYDFESSDPDRLSFRKNEVLEVVRQDESGWWGAVRIDGTEIGWIPAKFVRPLSDGVAQRVYEIHQRTRTPEYGTNPDSVQSAPPLSTRHGVVGTPSPATTYSNETPSDMRPLPSVWSAPTIAPERTSEPSISETEDHLNSPSISGLEDMTDLPSAIASSIVLPPVPQNPKPLPRLDKSLPASPDITTAPGSAAEWRVGGHGRNSSDSVISLSDSMLRRPAYLDGPSFLPGPSNVVRRVQTSSQLSTLAGPLDVPPSPLTYPFPHHACPRPGKVLQLTGDDSAQAFHNAKQAQANLPWFLKQRHGEEEIKLEFDGTVKAGTLPALVEHLVVDPLRVSQQEIFRRSFLVTFRTFATATEVFDLLIAQYELDAPPNLSEEEFEQWKREKLRPTQKRVLTVLTMWLEEYDLLNQDAEVAPKLQDFLNLVISPPSLAFTAKLILKSLERLTFAEPSAPGAVVMSSKKWKKVRKGDGLELVRMDPFQLAQHLSLFESDLYRKIRPQECFLWSKIKEGDTLADWVKCSVLEVPALGKRANVVDFWIRVAEKCRTLNNFSSMSSIVAALSSVLISRLHFTWVNSNKEHALEPLRKIIHPASNYRYYRDILSTIDGPCIPFVSPFLKNIVYAQEQHADNVFVKSAIHPERQFTLVHFVKRQKWYDITLQMLRFQAKPYNIPEIPEMTSFIVGQMEKAATMGERWYWQRSDEFQHAELVHADIRRGLEAAGF
ncbi:ras guanine nucleotide exchange factor domain-containing protein [Russula earlei]|uniref:Ras guanine nucleotide exchange factor domain-containing protein n=1 Tax=Russula earlei TaxID=71964 RepID=A0ACC0ULP4_9AGAM|nr:ras guanine nucleotide exchange factor domain-containing protein [Russula earlei]